MAVNRIVECNKPYMVLYMPHDVCSYAVFKYNGSFWQQVSPNYFRKGNAMRAYRRLTNEPTLINQPLN